MMKKTILAAAALLLAACGGKTSQSASLADSTAVATGSTTKTFVPDEAGKKYLEQFYRDIFGIDYGVAETIIRKNITAKAKQQLNDLYDYDCESGDCIPVWMFFEGGVVDMEQPHLVNVEQTAAATYRATLETNPIPGEGNFYRYHITFRLVKDGDSYKIDEIGDWKGEDIEATDSAKPTLPETAKRMDYTKEYYLYVNEDQPSANEGETPSVYSVWLVDRQTNAARRLFVTNPDAKPQWERMKGERPDAVSVPIDDIVSAERAWIVEEDGSKIVVEGCPDGRNEWTYLIDVPTMTAKQLPSASGMKGYDRGAHTVMVETYGYDEENGRYEYRRILTTDGKFVERTDAEEM